MRPLFKNLCVIYILLALAVLTDAKHKDGKPRVTKTTVVETHETGATHDNTGSAGAGFSQFIPGGNTGGQSSAGFRKFSSTIR